MTGSSWLQVTSWHGNSPLNVSSSVSIPLKGCKATPTKVELQRKVQDLKGQLIYERTQRHAVGQKLKELRHEHEKVLQQKQKLWENKFREIQKEKNMLSMRLQKLASESPKELLQRGREIHLTEDEIKHLQQEIAEQESLIKGYQIENERAVQKLKEIRAEAKERERLLTEENANLASQISSLKVSGTPRVSNAGLYTSLHESLNLKAQLQNVQAREEVLITELDKLQNHNKDLVDKVKHLEFSLSVQERITAEGCKNSLEKSYKIRETAKNVSPDMKRDKLLETVEDNEMIQDAKNMEERENCNQFDELLQRKISDKYQKEIQSLQKKMERMKRDHELQVAGLKQQLQQKSLAAATYHNGSEQATPRKAKDLEKQIDQIRSFYTKKVKELTEKLDANKKEKKQESNAGYSMMKKELLPHKELVKAQERVDMLENTLVEKEARIEELKKMILDVNEGPRNKADVIKVIEDSTSPMISEVRVQSCVDSTSERPVERKAVEGQETISQCLNKTQANSQGMLQKDMQKEPSPCSKGDPKETLSLVDEMQKVKTKEDMVGGARLPAVQTNAKLVHDAPYQSSGSPNLPLEILQQKVSEMEARQNQRELEWQALLIETKRILSLEHDMAERKWELAMEAKNAEIEQFKLELDAILEAAIKIQKKQLKPSALEYHGQVQDQENWARKQTILGA